MRQPPEMRQSPEIKAFCRDLRFLLRPSSPRGRSLFGFIRRSLVQYNLQGRYTPEDILQLACIRALIYLERQKRGIENPRAWLRTTSFRIIQELSRSERRLLQCQILHDVEDISCDAQVSNEAICDNIEASEIAFQNLSEYDQLILNLRCKIGLTWEKVGLELEARGYEKPTDGCLRKQGERAMKRLRKEFHQIRPSSSS